VETIQAVTLVTTQFETTQVTILATTLGITQVETILVATQATILEITLVATTLMAYNTIYSILVLKTVFNLVMNCMLL
jgi:hypothetical protein